MKNEIKYIWVVSAMNVMVDDDGIVIKINNTTNSYFSSKEKAQIHVETLKGFAKNNKCKEIVSNDFSAKYKLDNGEEWVIRTERCALDLDDLFVGYC